jgi:hypothetical protein
MTLTRASKCTRELLRRLRLPSKGHDVRFSTDLTASTQGTTQSLTDAMSPQPTLLPPATRGRHPPPEACLSLLHLCTGRRPVCTFALRTARGAVPTSTQA